MTYEDRRLFKRVFNTFWPVIDSSFVQFTFTMLIFPRRGCLSNVDTTLDIFFTSPTPPRSSNIHSVDNFMSEKLNVLTHPLPAPHAHPQKGHFSWTVLFLIPSRIRLVHIRINGDVMSSLRNEITNQKAQVQVQYTPYYSSWSNYNQLNKDWGTYLTKSRH